MKPRWKWNQEEPAIEEKKSEVEEASEESTEDKAEENDELELLI